MNKNVSHGLCITCSRVCVAALEPEDSFPESCGVWCALNMLNLVMIPEDLTGCDRYLPGPPSWELQKL